MLLGKYIPYMLKLTRALHRVLKRKAISLRKINATVNTSIEDFSSSHKRSEVLCFAPGTQRAIIIPRLAGEGFLYYYLEGAGQIPKACQPWGRFRRGFFRRDKKLLLMPCKWIGHFPKSLDSAHSTTQPLVQPISACSASDPPSTGYRTTGLTVLPREYRTIKFQWRLLRSASDIEVTGCPRHRWTAGCIHACTMSNALLLSLDNMIVPLFGDRWLTGD